MGARTTVEDKLRLGNPSCRPLPDRSALVAVPDGLVVDEAGEATLPEPARELGAAGKSMWDRVWSSGASWLAKPDVELVTLVCEQFDERAALRRTVMTYGDNRDRNSLRRLEVSIAKLLGVLGLTPTDRTRLGVARVIAESTVEMLRRERAAGE